MRILAIRGKNLASLAEPFEILLNEGPLQQAGLFAITGPTGAGKSTILDALCLALYDKMPRLPEGHGFAVGHKDEDENLRVTSNDVRSILRRGTGHAYAEVDFTGKDKHHYRARWEVSKARGKASGRLQAQDIILSNLASGQRLGQGKRNTLELISDLIDLNFDQFRRSVLLAQGDFAAFLKAKKDERSSLLERITGTDIYSELSIAAFERARQEKEALNRISALMQNQVPLDNEARLTLEMQRDQLTQQLAELDQHISGTQKIIDWYVELKKRRQAQRQAIEAHVDHQQLWDAAGPERLLIRKVEAVQPLRPLLSHYKTANDDYLDAEKTLNTSGDMQKTAEIALQTATEQLTVLLNQLQAAEHQQQQAQPLLKAARALDTRLDVIQNAINALTAEEHHLHKGLESAQQRHESLLKQQAEKTTALAQLTLWLEQHQALKPIAAEWNRWEGELQRYQTLKAQQTAQSLQAEQITIAINKDEPVLAELKKSLADYQGQLEQQQANLEQLKSQASQQPLEALYQEKDALEHSLNTFTHALTLSNQALELQQLIKQDTGKLAASKQLIHDASQQLQTVTGQQAVNDIALAEARKALDLFQATTHKNAGEFRRLLIKDQPCPVCGALEHPWQDHGSSSLAIATLINEQAIAQLGRVNELQSQKETLIKSSAELNNTITHALETHQAYTASLPQAQAKLESLGYEWSALALHDILNKSIDCGYCPYLPSGEACPEQDRRGRGEGFQNSPNPDPQYKPDFTLTGTRLLPLLNTQKEQSAKALELIKNREKAALELHKQLKNAQEKFEITKLKTEQLAYDYAELDKRLAKNKTDLDHINTTMQQQENQLQAIVDLLQTPFQQLENWRDYLQDSLDVHKNGHEITTPSYSLSLREREHDIQVIPNLLLKEKVQKFQQTEQVLASATSALVEINHEEKLAAQTLEQYLQHYKDKQAETRLNTQEQQALSAERDALLPNSGSGTRTSADSYEHSINQTVHSARAAHQQAGNAAMQLEKELASLQQQQHHWRLETSRRLSNRDTALTTLNQALEKHAITLEQLSDLLKQDDAWLTGQKTRMQALERALHESAATKGEDRGMPRARKPFG